MIQYTVGSGSGTSSTQQHPLQGSPHPVTQTCWRRQKSTGGWCGCFLWCYRIVLVWVNIHGMCVFRVFLLKCVNGRRNMKVKNERSIVKLYAKVRVTESMQWKCFDWISMNRSRLDDTVQHFKSLNPDSGPFKQSLPVPPSLLKSLFSINLEN